jgi:hypothetical protein
MLRKIRRRMKMREREREKKRVGGREELKEQKVKKTTKLPIVNALRSPSSFMCCFKLYGIYCRWYWISSETMFFFRMKLRKVLN